MFMGVNMQRFYFTNAKTFTDRLLRNDPADEASAGSPARVENHGVSVRVKDSRVFPHNCSVEWR